VTTDELLVLAGPAFLAAILVAIALRGRSLHPVLMVFMMIVAAAIAVILSFASTFTIAWGYSRSVLPIIVAAVVSAIVAAGLVAGPGVLAMRRH
jgi:hypothetical protein